MSRYTEQELRDIFFDALDFFSEALGSGITRDNTVLAFFTPDNGPEVYERFCRKHFPKNLDEDYKAEGYFQSFVAQAFVGKGRYGVMMRADIDFRLPELHRMFLHEISHLFCWENEIEGGGFFDRYCMGSGAEDGMMNAGYAVWRETVADIMADSILSDYTDLTLDDPLLFAIFRMVFDNIHRSPFWSITPEFIMDLGEAYLSLLSLKFLRENVT